MAAKAAMKNLTIEDMTIYERATTDGFRLEVNERSGQKRLFDSWRISRVQ